MGRPLPWGGGFDRNGVTFTVNDCFLLDRQLLAYSVEKLQTRDFEPALRSRESFFSGEIPSQRPEIKLSRVMEAVEIDAKFNHRVFQQHRPKTARRSGPVALLAGLIRSILRQDSVGRFSYNLVRPL